MGNKKMWFCLIKKALNFRIRAFARPAGFPFSTANLRPRRTNLHRERVNKNINNSKKTKILKFSLPQIALDCTWLPQIARDLLTKKSYSIL